jgi:alanyl-tRNA synthetase
MLSSQIRKAFLHYFKTQGHTIVPSSPVIPHDDPTLLFINAGMNQFKDVFLGKSKRDYTRAASTQKCVRVGGKHNDLENVGHTSRHLTLFEMLGNFSFGDYFKKEAIGYAWDVTRNVFGFDPEKVWVSVYKDDDEAYSLWEKHIPSSRIVRFGEKENFWAMGDTGPCGPCSELLYDRGEKYGSAKNPKEDLTGERYLEFWNLVFMQYSKDANGKMEPLPKQSIDTGAGLERVISLKMGVDSVFQTDILRALIDQVEMVSGKPYDMHDKILSPAYHVIADHIRSLSFAIADGVQPSNTDRGYVLRKILRRAVRYGRMLGLNKPFLADILPRLTQEMGEDFPELIASQSRIQEILTLEEEGFIKTLTRGGQLLSQVMERSQKTNNKISGDDAFKLKDTYGFPLEEIELMAKDENLQIDLARYEILEEEAKEKSRKAHKVESQKFDQNFFNDYTRTHKPCIFEGYHKTETEAHIQAIVINGRFTDEIHEGQEGMLLLDRTPFYAEMGGQVGDSGRIGNFEVYDTISPFPGVIAHLGKMGQGSLLKSRTVHAQIDSKRRCDIQNNHTATHLLHWALEKVLGPHIKQAGSLVDDKKLRFDFSHHKPLSGDELREIENLVNEKIRLDLPVHPYELKYEEAQKRPDIKQFFGEKYGDVVRVIDIDFSKELCGGTHTTRLGMIGLFKILKESSIASGVRRIEVVTGSLAENFIHQQEDLLEQITTALKATPATILEKLQSLIEQNKDLEICVKSFKKQEMKACVSKCLTQLQKIGDVHFIASVQPTLCPEDLTDFSNELLTQMKSGVVAVGVPNGDKCQLLIAVSNDLVAKKINAGQLIKEVASLIQGGGGGKPNMAQAGGKDPNGLEIAFDKLREILSKLHP